MVAHPDGSGRAFVYSQQEGKIWLVKVPPRGSEAAMQVGAGVPFIDLAGRALVLTGLALHPKFAANGRFFVSYTAASPACGVAGTSSDSSCQYQLVVEEFLAKAGVDYSMAAGAAPTEMKRIFTTALAQPADASSNQGQIFFRPGHGYLYLVTGHKIVRFDVDRLAAGNDEPEIFATGLGNPRGCSFDSERPSDLYCAGLDEQQNEQVYLISNKGGSGNHSATSTAMAAVAIIIGHGRPAAGVSPSIVGGIIYRGPADPSLNGRYLYTYGSSLWAAAETLAGNSLHVYPSARIPNVNVKCSRTSPLPCGGVAIAGTIVSLGQDNSKDAFLIATGGIYRVIPPGLCGGGAYPPRGPPQMPLWITRVMTIVGPIFGFVMMVATIWSCLPGDRGSAQAEPSWYIKVLCCSPGSANDTNNAPAGGQGVSTGTQAELAEIPSSLRL
ncbi:unnamed protein product [Urochloa humidicola]